MKNLLKTFLLLLIVAVCSFYVACSDNGTIAINKTELTVEKYDTAWLYVSGYDGEVVWESSDSSVATVEEGMITGIKEGSVTVKAKCKKKTFECSVTVSSCDAEKLELTAENEVELFNGEQKQLVAQLTYNNVPVENVRYSYALSDDLVAVDENGRITAKKVGETVVGISCNVENRSFEKSVKVKINEQYRIEILQKNIELYTYAEYEGKNYRNSELLSIALFDKNLEIEADKNKLSWEIVGNSDVASLDGNTVKGNRLGNVVVKAVYRLNDSVVLHDETGVNVRSVKKVIDSDVIDIDLTKKYIPNLSEILKSDTDLTVESITVNSFGKDEQELTPTDGGFSFTDFNSGKATLTLETNKISYVVEAELWDGIISSVGDMNVFMKTQTEYIRGNYILGSDIDMSTYNDGKGNDLWSTKARFVGNLDGRGYKIKNLHVSQGLFYTVNGRVSDLELIDIMTEGTSGTLAYTYERTGYGTLELDGVVVKMKKANNSYMASGLFRQLNISAAIAIRNCVVIVPESVSINANALISAKAVGTINVENNLLIGYDGVAAIDWQDSSGVHPVTLRGSQVVFNSVGDFLAAYSKNEINLDQSIIKKAIDCVDPT